MCDVCDRQLKENYSNYSSSRVLYRGELYGTCGGLVVSGFYQVSRGSFDQAVKELSEIEQYALKNRITLMIATVKPTDPAVDLLTRAGWTKSFDYSTRYGPRKLGSLQVWCKELIL